MVDISRIRRSREDAKRIKPEYQAPLGMQRGAFSPLPFGDEAMQERLLLLVDKDLWIVREEERVAFETTQNLRVGMGSEAGQDITEAFSILVPSTNFPPALNYANVGFEGSGGEVCSSNAGNENNAEFLIRSLPTLTLDMNILSGCLSQMERRKRYQQG